MVSLPCRNCRRRPPFFVTEQGLSPWLVLTIILILYLAFGCVMDSLSMILLTVPIFFPIVIGLDFGLPQEEFALWFGIMVLIVVEVGLITPPVGMNLFVINSMAKDIPLSQTYRGVFPFVMTDLIRVVILALFPFITLGLVRWLYLGGLFRRIPLPSRRQRRPARSR